MTVSRRLRQCPMRRSGEHLFTSRYILRKDKEIISNDIICSWCTTRKQ